MSRFLESRSCNDDYVPFRVTRGAYIEYVMDDKNATYPYPDANIYFKERPCFEQDPRLAAIDARLEQICAMEELRLNNDGGNDTERPPFHDDEEDPYLAAIDARLEHICAMEELRFNNDGELCDDDDYDDDGYEEYSLSDRYNDDEL